MNPSRPLDPQAADSLDLWHQMIASGDLGRLPSILAADAVFRSPAVYKPYEGAPALCLILNTAMKVFADFQYHRSFTAETGRDVVLEFSARVGDRQLKGVDIIRFDSEGRIAEFEVMVRPMSGVQALAGEMGRRLASAQHGARSG